MTEKQIRHAVALAFGLKWKHIKSRSHKYPLPTARRMYAWLCFSELNMMHKDIARNINRSRNAVTAMVNNMHIIDLELGQIEEKILKLINDEKV